MKILLVNNHTVHINHLQRSLAGHELEILEYQPGAKFNYQGKDLVILSGGGGEGLEIYDEHEEGRLWYDDEKQFVLDYDGPLIGICMGFEVVASAYGAPITQIGRLVRGSKAIKTTAPGKLLFGQSHIQQQEAHRWRLEDTPGDFQALAWSPTGVEIMKHERKPIIATQFHPELGGSIELDRLINQLCRQPSLA